LSASGASVRLQIPADAYYLGSIRKLLHSWAYHHGMDISRIHDIQIVITELVANIIQHTYGFDSSQLIQLKMFEAAGSLHVHIRDFGPRLPLDSFQPRELTDYRESGLGMHIIHKLSSDVSWNRTVPTGTQAEVLFTLD
jgi:anti-sigma regulatory factor (Ser/Thr protein kinase)